jgi:hypothetical protein
MGSDHWAGHVKVSKAVGAVHESTVEKHLTSKVVRNDHELAQARLKEASGKWRTWQVSTFQGSLLIEVSGHQLQEHFSYLGYRDCEALNIDHSSL